MLTSGRRQGQEHYTKLAAEHAQKTTIIITIHHHTIVIRKIYDLGLKKNNNISFFIIIEWFFKDY